MYMTLVGWPDDDPIVGSKLFTLCNNKSPFVVFDGFFYICFIGQSTWMYGYVVI
jgi:hypothetical protein